MITRDHKLPVQAVFATFPNLMSGKLEDVRALACALRRYTALSHLVNVRIKSSI